MDAQVWAGIDLCGSTLRYAEVEQYGGRHRLLRLGNCDFDFDGARELWEECSPEHLKTLSDALGDVYAGSVAQQLRVVVHPPRCHSFFSPVPAGTSPDRRAERLRQEAALLVQEKDAFRQRPGTLAAEPATGGMELVSDALYDERLRDGGRVKWFHVLAVPAEAQARLERMLEALPWSDGRWTASVQGIAQALGALGRKQNGARTPFALAVGRYPAHLELSLYHHQRWHFSLAAPTGTPADSTYFAAALLDHLKVKPAAVGRLFLYGHEIDPDAFAGLGRLLATAPQRLNPMPIVDLDPASFAADFDAEAYTPCIGASL